MEHKVISINLMALVRVCIVIFFLVAISFHAEAQISGPTTATTGSTSNYSFYNGSIYSRANWVVSNGTITSQTSSGNTYYCTVVWNTGCGFNSVLSFKNATTFLAHYDVTVSGNAPPNPSTGISMTQGCRATTLTPTSSPPAGVVWYWQTSPSGTDVSYPSSYTDVNSSWMYLRAYACGLWSSGTVSFKSVVINPSAPSASGTTICGDGTLVYSSSLGSQSDGVRWYTQSSGGSVVSYSSSISEYRSSPGSYTYYVAGYNSTANCESTTRTAVTSYIKQVPQINNAPAPSAVCDGTGIYYNPTSNMAGSTISWTQTQRSENIEKFSTILNGSGTIGFTPDNTGNTPGTLRYSVTPSNNGCTGASINYDVTINPIPTVAITSSQVICSGQSTSLAISNPNGVPGTVFSWTQSASNVSGASNSSGSSINQTLSVDHSSYGSVNYYVTASAYGCTSSSAASSVEVNAVPQFTNLPGSSELCSGSAFSLTPTVSLGSTSVTWTSSISGNINSSTVPSSGSTSISNSPQNTGNTNGTITYAVTANRFGCTNTKNYTLTVKPVPTVSITTVPTRCSSDPVSLTISNPNGVSGTTFSWTQSSNNITGAANGTGSSINQTLSSTNQLTAGTTTYTAVATANGCNNTGNVTSLVTVNPRPQITNTSQQLLLEGCSTMAVNFTPTSTISGTSFSWTSSGASSVTGNTVSGSGAISNTLTNVSTTLGTVNYVITPSLAGCSGTPKTLMVTVKPTPTVAITSVPAKCSSDLVSLTISNPNGVSGTTLSWTQTSTNITGAANGTGASINQTLSNTNQITVGYTTYTAYATANGCNSTGNVTSLVTVNPRPQITNTTQQLQLEGCSNMGVNFTPTSTIGGTSFSWTSSGSASITGNNVSGSGAINNTLTNVSTTAGTVNYVITPSLAGCSGTPKTLAVTVVPLPVIMLIGSDYLMYGKSTQLSTNASAYAYQWKKNGTAILNETQLNLSVKEVGNYTMSTRYSPGSALECTSSVKAINTSLNSQPAPVNFVSSTRILKEGLTSNASLYSLTAKEVSQTISYQDGIGRTFQTVGVGMSGNQTDLVVPIAYGKQGLTDTTYLPYATDNKDGRFRLFAIRNSSAQYSGSEQYDFYTTEDKVAHDNYPFARTIHRASPDARVVEQGAPGADWQPGTNHTVKNEVILNTASYPVIRWNADGTSAGTYPVGKVMMSSTADENGNVVRSYTNAQGQLVLKQVEAATGVWLQTYYVYDVYGRLKYQVSPKAVSLLDATPNLEADLNLAELIYKYTYDSIGRVVETKVPGAAVQFTVYDKLGRVVLTQDANQRAANQWLAIKYDYLNRPVYSGIYTNTTQTTRVAVQKLFTNATGPFYEKPEANASYHGYSSIVFPTNISPLTFNYYDSYDFDRNGSADYAYNNSDYSSAIQTSLRGMATGSKKLILGTTNWLVSVVFYDNYDRPIQTQSNNHKNLAVQDRTSVLYDFAGHMLETKSAHNGGTTVSLRQRYTYDDTWRTIAIHHSINGSTEQQVVAYEYNALGQVVDKKLHVSNGGTAWLQSVDLRYTIRGWLKSINNSQLNIEAAVNDDDNDYFGMELLYNTPASESGLGNTPYYNGNISAIKWKEIGTGAGSVGQRSYTYAYDKSDRLSTSNFKTATSTGWNKHVGAFNESMSYDVNGNINALSRSAKDSLGNITTIDNLSYTYSAGNQLSKVEDTGTQDGFLNGKLNGTQEYAYNAAGQLSKDENKKISSILYNNLSKVQQVVFTDGKTVSYTYDATGIKLGMSVVKGAVTNTTEYVGGFVYENNALAFFSSPEGRVVKNGSSYEYQYAIADHQGNTRIVFSSATPTPDAPVATLETANENNEAAKFLKYEDVRKINFDMFDHTNSAATKYAVRLSGTPSETYGLARSLAVAPGDKVKVEVFAKYVDPNSSNWTTTLNNLMTAIANGTTAPGTIIDGGFYGSPSASSIPFAGVLERENDNGTGPKAYLNWLVFDKTFEPIPSKSGFRRLSNLPKENGSDVPHEKLEMPEITITEAGYVYVWFSNENETPIEVYFDDFSVTHTPTNIVQYNEYYPFGLQTVNSWSREETINNNFLYNGGSELNSATNNYEMFFREYDPAIGRMNSVDPMADKYASLTPYNYSFNDPVYFNDPSGADPVFDRSLEYRYYIESRDQNKAYQDRGMYVSNPGLNNIYRQFGVSMSFGHLSYSEVGRAHEAEMKEDAKNLSIDEFADKYGEDADLWEVWEDTETNGRITETTFIGHKIKTVNGEDVWSNVPTQEELLDVTDKFNNQLRQTEAFFSAMKEVYDNLPMPNPVTAIALRRAAKLAFFKSQVGTNKPYDIKQKGKGFHPTEIGGTKAIYNGVEYNFDDFGNINYGVAAKALGITYLEALAGAGYNQTIQTGTPDWSNPEGFFDHSRDTQMIDFGFNMLVPKN